MISITALILFLPSLFIGAIGTVFIKKGAKKFRIDIQSQLKNLNLILGIIFTAISLALYIFTLKYADLSKIYPLVSFNYVILAVLSAVFLKEKITITKAIGIIFITLGCFLIIR